MILNGKEIEKLIKEKNIISNYNLENIRSSSYDITISNKALKFKSLDNEISLFDASKIENLYEEINIDNGYVLSSQKSILLSLKENINLPNNILAHIRPRTSFSRLGLLINFQHINPGYCGTLNILMYNVSPNSYKIFPNMNIGQLVLETLSSEVPEELLYFNEKTPVYQNETGNRGSKIYADFIGKVFRHYKGNYYFVENISMNSETMEYMVVYRTLYNNEDSNLWVRPATMFFEEIDPNLPNNITHQKHRFEVVNEMGKDYTKE